MTKLSNDSSMEEILETILKTENVTPVYQPLVCLKTGKIKGYEALSRFKFKELPELRINIEELFCLATETGQLWKLEKLCREAAIKKASDKPKDTLLFLNVDPNVIHDTHFESGFTKDLLWESGLSSKEIVFEITEREAINHRETFLNSVNHYRRQDFMVAIDDFGAKYSGLNRVCLVSPNYLKLDMELIQGVDHDNMKRAAVKSVITFCKEAGITTLAEGIETKSELKTLMAMGIDVGQGYYLARPKEEFENIPAEIKEQIIHTYAKMEKKKQAPIFGKIGQISEMRMFVNTETPSLELYETMKNNHDITEIFVLDDEGKVQGIITRAHMMEFYSGKFGYSIGQRLTAEKIMNSEFLSVEWDLDIETVVAKAMERKTRFVYDTIAVTQNGEYIGSVTIRKLLLKSVTFQTEKVYNHAQNIIEMPELSLPQAN